MKQIVATFLYVGHLKPAPGTWGSLAALPILWALHQLGGPWLVAAFILAAFLAGWWVTDGLIAGQADKDPSEIVIDEVVGQGIAILPVSVGAAIMGTEVLTLYPGWIAAFVLFRLFDIWKPGPVGWADRKGGTLGVMLDDVIAGIFAALGVVILAAGAHLFLMP